MPPRGHGQSVRREGALAARAWSSPYGERDHVGAGVWVHPRERRCWRSAAGERRGAMVLWRLSAVCAGDGDARWWCDRRSHRPGRM